MSKQILFPAMTAEVIEAHFFPDFHQPARWMIFSMIFMTTAMRVLHFSVELFSCN